MMSLLTGLLWLLCLPVAILVLTLIVELLLALRSLRPLPMAERLPVAILMPAHNESAVLSATLAKLRPQLLSTDRLLVVADNCSDNTAQLAIDAGAEVLERFDDDQRGKGFALAAGMAHLADDPREVVIIVDADCDVAEGGVAQLSAATAAVNKPVQALYLMHPPRGGELSGLIATFAFIVRNHVRPRGGAALGIPVHLMGTGMAFPWSV
ncbi:glycosyltransferase, partial [bacterium]|nr:glycosyltransferase [bacterium]